MEKTIAGIESPLQTTIFEMVFTCPLGFIVIVNVFAGPIQFVPPLAKVGVTVIVAIIGLVELFTGVKIGIFPVPEVAKPMLGVSFVQLYVVVPTVFVVEKEIAVDAVPAQNIKLFG